MVGRSKLELDDSLFEKRKPRRGGNTGEKAARPPRGRADNALAVLLVLTAALIALLALTYKRENWWAVWLIGIIFLASELFALPMKPGGRLSLALVPLVISMMVCGPVGTAVVALFGIPVFYLERGEQGARKVIYNAVEIIFAAGAAAWVFRHTGGGVIDTSLKNGGKLVIPWILAVLVFFVFNTILASLVLTPSGERVTRYWQRRLLTKFPGYVIYGGIGFLAAIVYVKLEFPAVVLLFAPLLAIRVVYTRYGTMRDVCDDTTLAVMDAVEKRGMFNEGHSLGVADMATSIAEEMEFPEEDIHYIRQGALLHDIGRLALDPSLFETTEPLTPEQYDEIKKHPLVAANIVSKESSFAVVAPAIRHHHEMIDGSGYPDGLAGETIPIGARILHVADSFDAMQRPTAFRGPLTKHDAASEVIRAKGIEFDPVVVDAFVKVVTRWGVWEGALKQKLRMPSAKAAEQPRLLEEPEQSKLEVAATTPGARSEAPAGATPADGIKYSEVRDEIEKDIREWERSDIARSRREPRRRAPRKKKDSET